MTLGEKLSKLRRENNYTQEQLGDILGVSRQAISKWEADTTFPETDKLIRISELFNSSLDYLLKNSIDSDNKEQNTHTSNPIFMKTFYEKKSNRILWGMPLWHIGKNAKGVFAVGLNARGVIAIGIKSKGVVSFGVLSIGILSFGMLSLGLLSLGMFALGVASAGCIAAGIFSAGAISFGIVSLGAIAIGDFSVGALAIGKYVAIGDNARAAIALGDTEAIGSIYQKIGELNPQEITAVKALIDTNAPSYLGWAKEFIKLFI